MNDPLRKVSGTRNRWFKGFAAGRDVYILAGGPSLIGFDLSRLDGQIVIAVNFSVVSYPNAQYCVALDKNFIIGMAKLGRPIEKQTGTKFVLGPSASIIKAANIYPFALSKNEVSTDVRYLHGPYSSTIPAINLAIMGGASRIILLGVDHGYKGEVSHYNLSDVPRKKVDKSRLKRKEVFYQRYAGHKGIIQTNKNSAIKCFKYGEIDEILRRVSPARNSGRRKYYG